MATQLAVYNAALAYLGEKPLTSLTSFRECRRVLDDSFETVQQNCLESGMWNFTLRLAFLASSGAGSFGKTFAFSKPSDLVHLFAAFTSTATDAQRVTDYFDNGAFYHADVNPFTFIYSSNDASSYGGLLTKWSQKFADLVSATLAARTALRITGSPKILEYAEASRAARLEEALAVDHVPTLPGLMPFNAQARAIISEVTAAHHARPDPFQSAPQPKRGGQ
jgi:hypothetical protein